MINKENTIREVAHKVGFTQRDVRTVIDGLRDVIYSEISAGGSIKPFEGVTFKGITRAAREAKNPKTQEVVKVPEKIVPHVSFGKYAKDIMGD